INVVGSLVLGVVVGVTLREQSGIPPEVARILGVGFCGGFTTFSTSALEAVKLWAEDGPDRAAAYTLITVLASGAAAALGLAFTAGCYRHAPAPARRRCEVTGITPSVPHRSTRLASRTSG